MLLAAIYKHLLCVGVRRAVLMHFLPRWSVFVVFDVSMLTCLCPLTNVTACGHHVSILATGLQIYHLHCI